MNKKIVFFDIDGTLLDMEVGVPDSAREAIKSLRKNGHMAFINTGRSRANITDADIGNIEFDGIVAGCGTYLEYNGKCLYNHILNQELVEDTTVLLRDHQMEVILEGPKYLYYYPEDLEHSLNPFKEQIEQRGGDVWVSVHEHHGHIVANKMSIQSPSQEKAEETRKWVPDKYDWIFHEMNFLELVPKGFNKARGISYICELFGTDRRDTYAFGDSNNDLDMIKYAGNGVAMGNSTQSILQMADYITCNLKDHGIFNGLRHFRLI